MTPIRKPGEPIYLRRHMVGLFLAVCVPILLLQLYKAYVGPLSFGIQLVIAALISSVAGMILYLAYRSSAKNEP
ncbi:MAG TPA: hypothetical protein VFS39_04805 [Nitrospira sp.]|nr:hypothetical protein [Nitrospira sp.]